MMKTHAFVRENFPKVLAYREEGMQKISNRHKIVPIDSKVGLLTAFIFTGEWGSLCLMSHKQLRSYADRIIAYSLIRHTGGVRDQIRDPWVRVIVYQLLRRPSVVCRPSVHNFKHLLLWNHWANWTQISHRDSLGWGNESLFKWSWSHDQDGRHAHIW